MDNNEHQRIAGPQAANGAVGHHDEAHLTDSSVLEEQKSLHEEVERLRFDVEHLLDQQEAFERSPQSNSIPANDEIEDDHSSTRNPAGRRGVLNRRPVKLILVLVV